ncbi:ComF family protein [Candidatus Liberibacter americanus]|uniref:Amidophosphoribosyltransferase n=1 Tax=Candidatus Liberibacter americanus str. Sao Paulo TaxID=1261131 RepID=U6B7P3_9HYPH|nr:ComF family protein [Candidatus Liberibacter americanus]AHA27742.1 amidophosphoribosyltransferase [Candidatus Liberibacter americanus str. Sao Paulo]EMS36127.1 competence protein F [Candidatus Liberibacter americanus PW_SP]
MIIQNIKFIFERLINYIYPKICPVCKITIDRDFCLCACCWSEVYFISTNMYNSANTKDISINKNSLFAHDMQLEQISSVALYCGISCILVRLLKYHDRIDLSVMMAKWMFRVGRVLIEESDLIIAIPLHYFRLMSRKYNQSAELARLIAKYGNKPFISGALIRSHYTKQQVELSFSARKKNIYNAFTVTDDFTQYLSGSKVLLIDECIHNRCNSTSSCYCYQKIRCKKCKHPNFC